MSTTKIRGSGSGGTSQLSAGSISNTDVNASAAIAYSKLATLGGSTDSVLVQSGGGFVSPHASIIGANIVRKDSDNIMAVNIDIDFGGNGGKIKGLPTPTLDSDAATKLYTDSLAAGLTFRAAVRVATATTLTLTTDYTRAGSGATHILTATANGALSIDGVSTGWVDIDNDGASPDPNTSLSASRVLVKNASDAKDNGIYAVKAKGDGSHPYKLIRSTDADGTPDFEVRGGVYVFVVIGTANTGRSYTISSPTGTAVLETDDIVWTQFAASASYTASNGIALVSNDFQLDLQSLSTTSIATGDFLVFADISDSNNEKKITALNFFNDLDVPNGISANGLITRTASDTYTSRTVTGTSNRISVTNGNGVSGNPTLDIDSAYVGQTSITTLGTIATGTWNGSVVAVTYGGTGLSTITSNGVVYGNGTSPAGVTSAGASDSILRSSAGTPTFTSNVFLDDSTQKLYTGAGTFTFQAFTNAIIKSANKTAGSTNSGTATLTSGDVSGATSDSGAIVVSSGPSTTSGNTGSLTLKSGVATSGGSGGINIFSGTGNAGTGDVSVFTGNATGSLSGSITMHTGTTTTSGQTGDIQIYTGTGSDVSGTITVTTGNATGLPTGEILLTTGNASSSTSGKITLSTGTGSTVGSIIFKIAGTQEADIAADGMNVATGNSYQVNNVSVLDATTLGSSIVTSSLTTVGTIGTGVWQGTVVGTLYGGTGLAITPSTIADGDLLIGYNSGDAFVRTTLTAGTGISITNGAGSISIAINDSTIVTNSDFVTEQFTGDGSTTAFDLATPAVAATDSIIHVYLNGIRQRPGGGNDIILTDADTVTFNFPPSSSDTITIDYIIA